MSWRTAVALAVFCCLLGFAIEARADFESHAIEESASLAKATRGALYITLSLSLS